MNILFKTVENAPPIGWTIFFAILLSCGILSIILGAKELFGESIGFVLGIILGIMGVIVGLIGLIFGLSNDSDPGQTSKTSVTTSSLHYEVLKNYGLDLTTAEIKKLEDAGTKSSIFSDHRQKYQNKGKVAYFGNLTTSTPDNEVINVQLLRVNKLYELAYLAPTNAPVKIVKDYNKK
jgi:hypothetical protein